jgi:hypothetical protein
MRRFWPGWKRAQTDQKQIDTIKGKKKAAEKAAGDRPFSARYMPSEQFDLVFIDSVADNSISYIYFQSGTVETTNTKPGASPPKVAELGKNIAGAPLPLVATRIKIKQKIKRKTRMKRMQARRPTARLSLRGRSLNDTR